MPTCLAQACPSQSNSYCWYQLSRSRTEMLSRMQSFAVDDGIVLPETQMPRMEGLLQALACESDSGHVLRRYIEKLHNQVGI